MAAYIPTVSKVGSALGPVRSDNVTEVSDKAISNDSSIHRRLEVSMFYTFQMCMETLLQERNKSLLFVWLSH